MKILALVTPAPGSTPEAMRPHLAAEVHHVWDGYAAGMVREMYLLGESRGAALVVEAASLEEARREMATLPLVKAGLAVVDCLELKPFSTLAALFAKP